MKREQGRYTRLCVCEKEHCAALSCAIVFYIQLLWDTIKKRSKTERNQLFSGGRLDSMHYLRHWRQLEGNHPFIRTNRKQKGDDRKSACVAGYRWRENEEPAPQCKRNWSKTLGKMGRTAGWDRALHVSTWATVWGQLRAQTPVNIEEKHFQAHAAQCLGSPIWSVHHFLTYFSGVDSISSRHAEPNPEMKDAFFIERRREQEMGQRDTVSGEVEGTIKMERRKNWTDFASHIYQHFPHALKPHGIKIWGFWLLLWFYLSLQFL